MNYYKHHIGDYRKDTQHLNLLEHGIYRQMLDQYYLDENPLTLDHAKLMRTLNARNADEQKAVENILADFFEKTPKGYKHKRCERQLSEVYEKSEKARASAKRRWDAASDANALPTDSDRIANGMLPTTHNPLPTTHNPDNISTPKGVEGESKIPPCPYKEIVKLYHEILPDLPKCEILNKTRQGYLKQRWIDKNHGLPDLDNWRNYFEYVSKSDFLMGKTEGRDGKPPFKANLEWLTKPLNYTKVYEGKYHGR